MRDLIVGAIDPGSNVIGLCALQSDASPLGWRVLELAAARVKGRSEVDRVDESGAVVAEFLERHAAELRRFDAIAIEAGYVGRNPQTALLLGMVRGAVIRELRRSVAVVELVEPDAARKAIGVKGGQKREVAKQDVRFRIVELFALKFAPSEDAADAGAAALWMGEKARQPVPF